MKSLQNILQRSAQEKNAVGHFNISDLATLKAIFSSAYRLHVPVIIGLSEGEMEFVGVSQAAALIESLRNDHDFPIYLNADHVHNLENVKRAVIAGFDQVIFDGSKLSFEENINQTKEAIEIGKSINPNVLVEGELGFIGSSSEIIDEIPQESLKLTAVDKARQFVQETGVDVFAPAVGNMHGLLKSMVTGETQKHLDIQRIEEIKKATGKLLTLHGGSGTADKDLKAAINAGINIVHINTELRVAWRKGVEEELSQNPQEVAPYKILSKAVERIEDVVSERLRLFNYTI